MFGRDDNDNSLAGLGSLSQGSASIGRPQAEPQAVATTEATGRSGRGVSPVKVVRVVIGLAMMLGGFAYAGWAIYELASYGTCVSGGPYVSARECAPGTGTKIVGIIGSVFVVLIGIAVVGSARAGYAAWGITFTGLSALFFAMGMSDQAGEEIGLEAMGFGMGAMFVLMGLPGLWVALRPPSRAERRQVEVEGAYGIQMSVDAPEDGGPTRIVMARQAPRD